MNIEHATIEHIPALNKLINSAYRGIPSKRGWTTEADLLDGIRIDEERLKQYIETPNSTFIMLTKSPKIIACVHLEAKEDALYLGMLTVDPKMQDRGLGRLLLQASEDLARQNEIPLIRMDVISVRAELIAWYERQGYKRTGKINPFPMEDPRFGVPKQPLEFIEMQKTIKK